jgi:hypothetical protein
MFDYLRFMQVLDEREIRRAVSKQANADEFAKVLSVGIVRLAPLRSVVITITLQAFLPFSPIEDTLEVLAAVAKWQRDVRDASFILRDGWRFWHDDYGQHQKAAEHIAWAVAVQRSLETFRLENFTHGMPTIFNGLAMQVHSLREAYFICCTFWDSIAWPNQFKNSNTLTMVIFNGCSHESSVVNAFKAICSGVAVKR